MKTKSSVLMLVAVAAGVSVALVGAFFIVIGLMGDNTNNEVSPIGKVEYSIDADEIIPSEDITILEKEFNIAIPKNVTASELKELLDAHMDEIDPKIKLGSASPKKCCANVGRANKKYSYDEGRTQPNSCVSGSCRASIYTTSSGFVYDWKTPNGKVEKRKL